MAREENRFELKLVDEEVEEPILVIQLGSKESLPKLETVRLELPSEKVKPGQNPESAAPEDFEIRSRRAGIKAYLETNAANTKLHAQEFGRFLVRHNGIPLGWMILIGLLLAGGVFWSLNRVKRGGVRAGQIRATTESVLDKNAREDQEATALVLRIDAATRKFFNTTSIGELALLVRQPERVRPLMESYYDGKTIPPNRFLRTKVLQPITLDKRADFWMEVVELADHETRNLVVEILASGEPKIDWETLVCHQPMKWDTFAIERPAGIPLDFRVYVQQDSFFSHEFADSHRWNCFRLTTLNGDETLFGYVAADSDIARSMENLLKANRGRKTAAILRLVIPEGYQSRRGVVIQKLLSPRWLYVDPPDPSP